MTQRPWDTLAARFIIVMTGALILSKLVSMALVQIDMERIVTWNVVSGQVSQARDWARATGPVDGEWLSSTPAAQTARQAPQIIDRIDAAPGANLIAGWVDLGATGPMGDKPVQSPLIDAMDVLLVSARQPDGQWRNIMIGPQLRLWPLPAPMVISLSASLIFIVAAAALAGARIAGPFRALAAGADRLARGERHEPLGIWGPVDVRTAQTAFNTMAARMDATLTGQRALLVALGHDLRTPLTAMRVRAEMLENSQDRQRFLTSLDELDRLTEAALTAGAGAFAKDTPETMDLGALLDAVCADFEDTGANVTLQAPAERIVAQAWPEALRRALRNLIDNALRYGHSATVSIETTAAMCAIHIDDEGPGIRHADLERVTQPLVRLEESRSQETGGHGLGLAIAKSVAEAHGGALKLSNRPGGGLRASMVLPVR